MRMGHLNKISINEYNRHNAYRGGRVAFPAIIIEMSGSAGCTNAADPEGDK